MKVLECWQHFLHHKSMGIFPDAQGQLTPKSMVWFGQILNSSVLLWLFWLSARMKKIRSKMKALECWQRFLHYKSMGIFPDAQGQLTPQSMVWFGRISNSFVLLWLSWLPARMKKIHSKMKALECWQHFLHYKSIGIFTRGSRATNSAVLGPIWPNCELVWDVMNVLVTCKNQEDLIKNEGPRVLTTFSPL